MINGGVVPNLDEPSGPLLDLHASKLIIAFSSLFSGCNPVPGRKAAGQKSALSVLARKGHLILITSELFCCLSVRIFWEFPEEHQDT